MRGKIVRLCALLALIAVAIWGIGFFIQSWAMLDLNKITALPQSTVIYDDGKRAVEIISGVQNRTKVLLSDIPKHVVNAFLAAEDVRFYSHHGIDLYRIGGALINNIKSGDYSQGASTITQQLIKLTHLTNDKTIQRKAREAILALHLETVLSKDEILEAYLNTVYFGNGAYGIDAAARQYMGVEAKNLTLSQGAMLSGVIKSPSGYSPDDNYEKSKARRDMILRLMAEYGYISEQEADEAIKQDEDIKENVTSRNYAWFTDEAAKEAAQALGISYDELLSGGYRLYTSLNADLQKSAQKMFDEESNFPSSANGTVQAALVSVDSKTGEVTAMVGGRNREVDRGFNRASDMLRQPGSAFKPVSVYMAAVDRYGFMPTSFLDDTKREFDNGYSPGNVSDNYYGTVTLRQALSKSLNVASVDLISRIGVDAAFNYAKRAGAKLSDSDRNLSLALGSLTNGVSAENLAACYAPLANGGNSVYPHLIRHIEDSEGHVVYEHRLKTERIISPESSRIVTDMLITAATSGTARALSGLEFPVAGKTGTVGEGTYGNRDVWSVAYTPKTVLCVWMGYDEPDKEHCMPNTVTGSNYPTRLAYKLMNEDVKAFDGGSFATPDSLAVIPIDLKALNEKGRVMLVSDVTPKSYTVNELFQRSNTPKEVSDAWIAPSKVFDLYIVRQGKSVVISFTSIDDYALYRIYRVGNLSDELIAEVSAPAGEKIVVESEYADRNVGYYVVGVEKTLNAEGIELEGQPSQVVYEAKTLQWNSGQNDMGQDNFIEEVPLFG